MLASLPFLLLTLLVYAINKELQNRHGKCLMCYLLGLIGYYVSLGLMDLFAEFFIVRPVLCNAIRTSGYFSLLVCMFWLHTMCFDIYFTFK